MENVPFTFSLALCIRTRPDLRTAMMITRGFFAAGLEFGGGGEAGYAASSMILMCVMYDSCTVDKKVSQLPRDLARWVAVSYMIRPHPSCQSSCQ